MNYYEILEVSKNATQDEIRKQYKKKAIILHPDKGGCEEKFKEVNEAYSVLSDEKKRQEYDMFGKNNISDIDFQNDPFFNLFFRQNNNPEFIHKKSNIKKNNNIEILIELSLEDIYNGILKSFSYNRNENCNKCINNSIKTCEMCNGSGYIIQIQNFGIFMQKIQNICYNCLGKGKVLSKNESCIICHGKNFISMKKNRQIKIQKGISTDYKMIIKNEGHQDIERGNGDLIISFKELSHKSFIRDKNNLLLKKNVNIYDVLYKNNISITLLDNKKIYLEATFDEVICINNQGMFYFTENNDSVNNNDSANLAKGNLYVVFNIIYPSKDIPKNITINKNNNILSINDNNITINTANLLSLLFEQNNNNTIKNNNITHITRLNQNTINKIKLKVSELSNNHDDNCNIQ